MAENNNSNPSGPGFIFIEYNTDYNTPKVADIQVFSKADKSFENYMSDRYWRYFANKRIPENMLVARETDDISRFPARGTETPTEYYENNGELLKTASTEADKRNLLNVAFCIENSIPLDSFKALPFALHLNPEYRLYEVVNDISYRQLYCNFSKRQKNTLIKMLNKDNPSMHLTGIPAIGSEPAYRPQWAQEKYGRKEESQDKDITIEDIRNEIAGSGKKQKPEAPRNERPKPEKRVSPPAVDRRTPAPPKKKNGPKF